MEIEIKKIGQIEGKDDFQTFCPVCNIECCGYIPEHLVRTVKAHLRLSHNIDLDKPSETKEKEK
jgi:hypothetical protein